MGRFVLVKPLTLVAHLIFCNLTTSSPRFWRILYLEYWSKTYFNWESKSYCTKPGSLSLEEVEMKEEIQSWFQGLNYKEGFIPGEFPPAKVRKSQMDTHAIFSAIS